MRYLFLMTLGPVQDFIVAARRTRDLWFGSHLLSELAREAATTLQAQGGTLIFPTLTAAPHSSIANKILAVVDAAPEPLAETVEEAVRARLDTLWQQARGQLPNQALEEHASQANAQLRDLLELYWVALPLASDAGYPTARQQAESLMAARKTARDFQPVCWAGSRYKSSLDGQRESVIPERRYARPSDSTESRQHKNRQLFGMYRARPGERLSGVDLLKRLGGGRGQSFPSTSDMAALPLVEGPLSAKPQPVAAYLKALSGMRPIAELPTTLAADEGGELLFAERLRDSFDEAALPQAQQALSQLLQEVGAEPNPYYVILQADGDRMGEVIDHLTHRAPQEEAIERHKALSETLAAFVEGAHGTIREHRGRPIYLGGDDLLAFLPLHRALCCAATLAEDFRKAFAGEAYQFEDQEGLLRQPTLSVGLAIVHHLEPLYSALETARQAEQAAKKVVGKDALAITLAKRSGAPRTVRGPWRAPNGAASLIERLETFTTLHKAQLMSGRTAYELHSLAQRLPLPAGGAARAAHIAMRQHEVARLLGRRRAEGGSTMDDETRAQLLRLAEEATQHGQAQGDPLAHLAEEIIVAALFAQAAQMANAVTEVGS